jgi:hypothetical protein
VKSVIAGAAGVLLATLGVAAWQARTAAPAFPASARFAEGVATVPVASTASQALPFAVRCAPGQQAVMRQIVVNGQLTAAAECTDAIAPGAYVASPNAYGASLVQPVSSDIVQWQQPRVEPARYVVREPAPRRTVRESRQRNWKKTALVIGGSAGAGAGVGAIAGGKKGALIGAAIGGGAASLYEALKK